MNSRDRTSETLPENASVPRPRRIAVVSTASGSGKTTLAKQLATRMGAPFIELDALVHGPNWVETPTPTLLATLAPILAAPSWVIDGNYRGKIGDTVISQADLIVWLDLPTRVWLPRLIVRTARRWLTRETLWNGNRETLRSALIDHDSLFRRALRTHERRRARWAADFTAYACARLRSSAEVRAFLEAFSARSE